MMDSKCSLWLCLSFLVGNGCLRAAGIELGKFSQTVLFESLAVRAPWLFHSVTPQACPGPGALYLGSVAVTIEMQIPQGLSHTCQTPYCTWQSLESWPQTSLEALWPEELKKAGRCGSPRTGFHSHPAAPCQLFHCELRVLTAQ